MKRIFLFLLAFGAVASAQPQAKSPALAFEAASIKPNNSANMASMSQLNNGGRFTATNVTLKYLIQQAFKLQSFEISGGPNWLESAHYDIVAKPEDGMNPTSEQSLEMLQTLLAERFQLRFHQEAKETTVYVLLGGKTPKLRPAADPKSSGGRTGRGLMMVTGYSLDRVAKTLSNILGRTVLNKTDIDGVFDLDLRWTPDSSPNANPSSSPATEAVSALEPAGPSIFTALQEQLGLRLESQKGTAQFFVIDRAEKPAENH